MSSMRNPESIHPHTLPNRKSPYESPEEEAAAQQEAIEAQLNSWRPILPELLAKFARIKDPRRPRSVRHKLTSVLFFGLLLFVFQCTSRREANRELTDPSVLAKIKSVFPEIDSIPHYDTVERLLEEVPPEEIEVILGHIIHKLIKNKKLQSLMQNKGYIVAIDGTEKHTGNLMFDGRALNRQRRDGTTRYVVYVLEAVLVSPQGISLPLLAEFCANQEESYDKQDCELKAFYRLAPRLKRLFPKLHLTIVADSLYPSGPVLSICRKYNWDFMIVLKPGKLPSVWDDAIGIMKLTKKENKKENKWGKRNQVLRWANDIEYDWTDSDGHKHRTKIHVVVCLERWEETNEKGEILKKRSTWAWVSDKPFTAKNVANRCNLIGRSRWGIESNIDQEKKHGYSFEHVFSEDWNAMQGWHALMRLAHILNTITLHTKDLWDMVITKGIGGMLKFLRELLRNPWIDLTRLLELVKKPPQLRLVI